MQKIPDTSDDGLRPSLWHSVCVSRRTPIQFCSSPGWWPQKTAVLQSLWSNFPSNFSIKLNLTNSYSIAGPGDRALLRKGEGDWIESFLIRLSQRIHMNTFVVKWVVLHLVFSQKWNLPDFAITLERQNSLLHICSVLILPLSLQKHVVAPKC